MNRLAALLLVVASIATACEADSVGEQSSSSPTGSGSAGPVASPPPSQNNVALPEGLTRALVTGVVDGDTIDVEIDGETYRLRYIGIDTPETVDPRRPVGCFGREASAFNRELVMGKTVGLEKDVSETDDFGRLLRYVWLASESGPEMINATLVEAGYAQASTYPPDVKYQEMFLELQTQAREAARGLWSAVCASPTPPVVADDGCEFSGTSEPVIKGNISSSTGEKIYHVPGQQYYDETVINEAKGEQWFCAEADAVAAGWRKAKV